MGVRKVTLTLDECSEMRCLLEKKINDIALKLAVIDKDSNDDFDKELYSYWNSRRMTLREIHHKLCCPVVDDDSEN